MDTVTEHETAICLAQNGGIGIVHKNLPIAAQAAEVDKVKRSESGMIFDPITMRPEQRIHEALEVMARYKISGVPITRDGKAVGILTNRDLRFVRDTHQEISRFMTSEGLVTVPPGTDDGAREGAAPRAPDREAARGRRAREPARPDHDQGHREERALPGRGQGRAGPAALRRRGGRGRQTARARRRRSWTRASTWWWSTPRTVTRRA